MSEQIWDSCLQREIPFEMIDFENHPTPADLEKRLGKELVDVYFQTCTPIEKIFFGRDKSLKGPEDKTLWISPDDRLSGDICMKELKTDCLQALTHRGIMDIGRKIEDKIAIQQQEVVEVAVKETEELDRYEKEFKLCFVRY